MAPEATNRESNSFDAILDNTNPEKLVQIIREKRGLQNAKRIFPETNVEKKSNKRKSFPFEIQTRPITPPAENVESSNENSVNVATSKIIPKGRNKNKDQTQNKSESENDENRNKFRFKVPPRRKSHNLGRRVLLKAFEITPKVDEFYPVASSTPLQRSAPCEEFGSFISNINRDSGDEVSSSTQCKNIEEQGERGQHSKNARQEHNEEESIITETDQQHKSQHQKRKSHRKSETIKQPKTITESLLCQSHEVHQNNNEDHQDHHGTQHYNDGIEVDETLMGPSPNEIALPVPNDNVNDENEDNLAEGTLINEEIFDLHEERPSSTAKSLEVRKEGTQLTFNNKAVHQERQSIDATQKATINESRTVPSSRQSEPRIPLNNQSTENNLASKTRQSGGEHVREQTFSGSLAYSELISALADKVRQSKGRESNILVPPSPFRSGYSPRKSQGASFSVPPTQSPQIQPIHVSCAKSPTLVIPIYRYTCHQSKTSDLPTTATVVSHENKGSENAATNVDSEILDARHKRVSNQKDSEKGQNQSRLSTKATEIHHHSSIRTLRDPEITEDEDNSREQVHVHHPDLTSDKETVAHQSRAVDLRLPSRRSDLHRLSLQPMMSRSRVYEKNKSQNVSQNSDSPSDSFDRIIEIDKLLKKLNSSNTIDVIKGQETVQPNEEPVAETHENIQNQTKRLQNEVILSEINENIIEPVGREDAGNGYVYDLSPRFGKIYMESLLKSRTARNTLNSKARGRRRNISNLPPHDNIENMQRQLKSRKSQKLPPNRKSRRKLYSKENFEKDLSDDETQPFENTTHMHDATAGSQQSIFDNKSKISKCRIRPEPVRFLTIQQIKERCSKSDPAPPPNKLLKRKKEPTKTISDDDELLFKMPEQPPPKRRTVQSRVNNRVGSNIKQVLGVGKNKSKRDEGNDSSNSSSDESSYSENLQTNKENQVSKQLEIVPASGESLFSQASKSIRNNIDRHSRRMNGSLEQEHVNPILNESLSRRQQFFSSPSLPAIEEISGTITESSKNQCEQEQPVEPELIRDKNSHNVKSFTTPVLRSSVKNISKRAQKNDNQSGSCKNKPVDTQNTWSKESNKSSTPGSIIEKEVAASGVSKKRDKNRKATSDKSSSSISTDNQSSTLRRSARKHRPPQPYWTSRFIRSEEICYKEEKVTYRRKRRTRMESIHESPEALVAEHNEPQHLTDDSRSKHKDPKQLADDLFDAVKELSVYKQTSILPAPKTTKVTRSKKKHVRGTKQNLRSSTSDTNSPNEVANNNSEVHLLTDSGHGTESDPEAQKKSKNLLLSWLKNLVEPKTLSSNPAIFSIFELSGVEIVPASTLVFRELDGVEYAYYSKSAGGNIYGYMRFHPGSVKRKVKTKSFELRILNITGELTLIVDKEEGRLRNGDFITVPKSTAYSIANKSEEMALIFFIKST